MVANRIAMLAMIEDGLVKVMPKLMNNCGDIGPSCLSILLGVEWLSFFDSLVKEIVCLFVFSH